ncbi:9214_t:CDS:2 [Acaulospora morrowiae]|uniref:9214_t:CDS:1 n=1 Tax=Acaulospora morrowiae TaxID=94023 RepID=A0A9N8WK84_9GLOM|nr:9214_t:CDS:2 [Acaulospora morrowiae]
MLANRFRIRNFLSFSSTAKVITCSLLLTQITPQLFSTNYSGISSRMFQENSVSARVVFVTCPNNTVAKKLSRGLVEGKLAACVNIVHGITSLYWWDNKIEETTEQMLLIKTEEKHVQEVTEYVIKNHGYEVPEVIAIKIDSGSKSYLDWIKDTTK